MPVPTAKTRLQRNPGARNSADRRRRLIQWMRAKGRPIHGDELARQFRVSRQCLVQDVAILRARGEEILSTRKATGCRARNPRRTAR